MKYILSSYLDKESFIATWRARFKSVILTREHRGARGSTM